MKHGFRANAAGRLALTLLLAFVCLFSGAAEAGGKVEIESLTADFSIVSAEEIRTRFNFKINANGKRLKDFKLSGEASFYKWSSDTMHCLTETGNKVGLARVPRADGLTAMKISPKRRIKAKSLSCVMEGYIDPQHVEYLLVGKASGLYHLAITLPAVTTRTGTLNITIHFPGTITKDNVMLDDMTAEEFSARFFTSAVTLTASSVPAYQAKTIELVLGRSALGGLSGFYGPLQPSDGELSRFVGMQSRDERGLRFSLIIFIVSVFLFILLLARSALRRNREEQALRGSPHIVFAGISGLTRAVFALCLIMLFAVFTLSESPIEAMLFFTCAVIMHLRMKTAATASGPYGAEEEEPADVSADDAGRPEAPLKQKQGFFSLKRAGNFVLLVLFLGAAFSTVKLVSGVSLESAVCLGFAFLLSLIFLFFSPDFSKVSRGSELES